MERPAYGELWDLFSWAKLYWNWAHISVIGQMVKESREVFHIRPNTNNKKWFLGRSRRKNHKNYVFEWLEEGWGWYEIVWKSTYSWMFEAIAVWFMQLNETPVTEHAIWRTRVNMLLSWGHMVGGVNVAEMEREYVKRWSLQIAKGRTRRTNCGWGRAQTFGGHQVERENWDEG